VGREAWATSGKLATITELVRRRGLPGALGEGAVPSAWDDSVTEEIAAALAMSRPATLKLINLAVALATRLDATAAALEAGQIDYLKARIVAEATALLDDEAASNAEKLHLTMEAEQVIQDTATAYKKAGLDGGMDFLRARAFTDKILGKDPLRNGDDVDAGFRADVHLTLPVVFLPLLTLLGVADNPGEAGGWGAVDAGMVRDLAVRAAAAGNASRWHLTLTDEHG
jgi:hypothetical protein